MVNTAAGGPPPPCPVYIPNNGAVLTRPSQLLKSLVPDRICDKVLCSHQNQQNSWSRFIHFSMKNCVRFLSVYIYPSKTDIIIFLVFEIRDEASILNKFLTENLVRLS